MPGFQNGHNTCVKVDNWKQLQRFFATRELAVQIFEQARLFGRTSKVT